MLVTDEIDKEESNDKLKVLIKDFKVKSETDKKALANKTSEINQLRKSLSSKQDRFHELNMAYHEIQSDFRDQEHQNEELEIENRRLESQINSARRDLHRKNQELIQLKNGEGTFRDELNALKRQNVDLKRQNSVLVAESEKLKNITVTNSRLLRYDFT